MQILLEKRDGEAVQLGDKTGPNSTYFVKEKNGLALDKLGSSKFACRKKVALHQTPTDPPPFCRVWKFGLKDLGSEDPETFNLFPLSDELPDESPDHFHPRKTSDSDRIKGSSPSFDTYSEPQNNELDSTEANPEEREIE